MSEDKVESRTEREWLEAKAQSFLMGRNIPDKDSTISSFADFAEIVIADRALAASRSEATPQRDIAIAEGSAKYWMDEYERMKTMHESACRRYIRAEEKLAGAPAAGSTERAALREIQVWLKKSSVPLSGAVAGMIEAIVDGVLTDTDVAKGE